MGGDRRVGAAVIATVKHGDINQRWSLRGNLIQSMMTGLVMEVESGAEVVMKQKGENSNQMWFLYSV